MPRRRTLPPALLELVRSIPPPFWGSESVRERVHPGAIDEEVAVTVLYHARNESYGVTLSRTHRLRTWAYVLGVQDRYLLTIIHEGRRERVFPGTIRDDVEALFHEVYWHLHERLVGGEPILEHWKRNVLDW